MKTFEISLENGLLTKVEGEIVLINDNTGQSIIYSDKNLCAENIVAVIPASGAIKVIQ